MLHNVEAASPSLVFGKLYQLPKGPFCYLRKTPVRFSSFENLFFGLPALSFLITELEHPITTSPLLPGRSMSRALGVVRRHSEMLTILVSILSYPEVNYRAFWASCHSCASDSAPCTRCKTVCSVLRKSNEGFHLDVRDTTTHMGPLVCLSSDAHTSNPDTPHGLADPVPNHGSQIVLSGF